MLDVDIEPIPVDRLESVLGRETHRRPASSLRRAAASLASQRVWSVNSTAKGGGVAEMLSSMNGCLAGAGITPGGWSSRRTTSSSG
jgi:trehalose synthase